MFMHLFCDPSGSDSSLKSLKLTPKGLSEVNGLDDFEGSDFDPDDGGMDFDPSLDEIDFLGDFGLDDEPTEPEFGDFWIDTPEPWG